MVKNQDAMIKLIQHIYETNMYAEINTKTSYCYDCGYQDIQLNDDMEWYCPNCGNEDFDRMNVAVRVCGYISTNPVNEGRAQDIKERVYHIGNE